MRMRSRSAAAPVAFPALIALIVLIGSLGAAFLAIPARAGDPELAKFLVKQGRTALEKGQAEEALAKFLRAREEDPDTVEASWWAGQACEKKSDSPGAIAAYRRFLEDHEVKRQAGRSSADEAALAKKAQARLDVLAAGDSEFRRLEDGYVGQLLAFARANAAKDPALAERAVRMALEVAPDSPDATKALAELAKKAPPGTDAPPAASPAAPPAASPSVPPTKPEALAEGKFAWVKTWTDLLAVRAFSGDDWAYEEPGLVVNKKGEGEIAWVDHAPDAAGRFVMEMEAKVAIEWDLGWHCGLVFGRHGDEFIAVTMTPSAVHLLLEKEGEDHGERLAKVVVDQVRTGTWHRLLVEVDGAKVRAWLDGKPVLDHEIPGRDRIDGETGLWQQHCKAEYRRVRLGTKD